ncbi:MAG: hypothetical protein J6J75_05315 [Alistipes sp.]|jgi:hypothetical protein|nr:hypothetical protein [Alistipes sp.]
MNKNLSYESPEIFVEKFICEEGFAISRVTYGNADGLNDEFDETYSTSSYEAFFMNEY